MNEEYIINQDGFLSQYHGEGGDVVIPEGVTRIGSLAFSGCQSLVSISIPQSVTTIEGGAFKHCHQLTSVSVLGDVSWIPYDAFKDCDRLSSVRLPASVTEIGRSAFEGCSALESIDLPASVRTIRTCAFADCFSLRAIELPEGAYEIGGGAFENCKALTSLSLPSTMSKIGQDAFLGSGIREIELPPSMAVGDRGRFLADIGVFDENGCAIEDGVLYKCVPKGEVLRVPDGVRVIEKDVLSRLFGYYVRQKPTRIVFPDSLTSIKDNHIPSTVAVDLPQDFLRRNIDLSVSTLECLLQGPWGASLSQDDRVRLWFFRSSPVANNMAAAAVNADPNAAVESFLRILSERVTEPFALKAAEFVFSHKEVIREELIRQLYAFFREKKIKKAAGLLANVLDKKGSTDGEGAPVDPIEAFCKEKFVEYYLDQALTKSHFTIKSNAVRYKEGGQYAPDFVVKCVIAPYLEQLTERPTHTSEYRTAISPFRIRPDADYVAAALDREDLLRLLRDRVPVDQAYTSPQALAPLCRFGTDADVDRVISAMNKWSKWGSYGKSGRSAIIVARGAVLLSDTRAAAIYADKVGLLRYYANLHGTDAEILHEKQLADFGLDENGVKVYDLGNATIEVSLGRNLALTLYDRDTGKVVNALPKRGADPDKYQKASDSLSDMKKNLKKVVKARSEELLGRFLFESRVSQDAQHWKDSYLKIPLLHRIAELIVWRQGESRFTLDKEGARDVTGAAYEIGDEDVYIAHPMSMTQAEVAAWQRYFTEEGLTQPFDQIWEPVVDTDAVTPDRYKGVRFPFYRFKGQEKHGIRVDDQSYFEDGRYYRNVRIELSGLQSVVERVEGSVDRIDANDLYEIGHLSVPRRSYVANHVLAYLDKITVISRIYQDDPSIRSMLDEFTSVQIDEFLSIASEKQCVKVMALLLDHKNKHFAHVDPLNTLTFDLPEEAPTRLADLPAEESLSEAEAQIDAFVTQLRERCAGIPHKRTLSAIVSENRDLVIPVTETVLLRIKGVGWNDYLMQEGILAVPKPVKGKKEASAAALKRLEKERQKAEKEREKMALAAEKEAAREMAYDLGLEHLEEQVRANGAFASFAAVTNAFTKSGVSWAAFLHAAEARGITDVEQALRERGIIEKTEDRLDRAVAALKVRYDILPKQTSIKALLDENPDLESDLTDHAARFWKQKSLKDYLLQEGILLPEERGDISEGVKYRPGEEPEDIKNRLDRLFSKFAVAFPDKKYFGLSSTHKKWGEAVTDLYRKLGYRSGADFLAAYGYTPADGVTGGRPKKDYGTILEQVKAKYPDGPVWTSVQELIDDNPDVPELNTLRAKSQQIFGCKFLDYCIQYGLLKAKA